LAKTVTIASAVGGCGKSTFAVSLAYALAAREKSVLLIDLSPASPSLASLCSVSESVLYTIFDLVDGSVGAETVILPLPEKKGEPERQRISLVPALPCFSCVGEGVGKAVRALELASEADFVIVDASLDAYPHVALFSDECILLTDTRESSLSASEALAYAFSEEYRFTQFVLKSSLVRERIVRDEPFLDIIDRLATVPLGILPQSDLIFDTGLLLYKKHAREPYVLAVKNIAARLLGENVPLLRGITPEGISRVAFFAR